MIKKFFSALALVLFATSMMAQTGLTCEDPIPVDENYTATISGPCELWYVANTYDLPLHVYFSPFADNSTFGPEVMIDFTCEEGVYDDPKLDSLVNMVSDFGLVFPVELLTDMVVRDGKTEWDLSIDKSYRERMAEFGITYNVKALVKVTFFEGGNISLKPDELFKNCMETSDLITLGDTIDVSPNDSERSFIVSYADWQNDSIRFVWVGEEPAQVWLAETMCDFEPSLVDPFVWSYFDVAQEAPYKLYSEQMKKDIKEHAGGGLFYGKIISPVAGKLVVEKIPMSKPKGDAELLVYGKTITIPANGVNKLYCFPKTWTSTEFASVTEYGVEMYVSNQVDFSATSEDNNILASYAFNTEGTTKMLYLSTKEISDLAAQATDDYIYVRFRSASTISITPNAWNALECLEYSVQIDPNIEKFISNNSNATIYRLRYEDFSGYDMTIKWNGNGILPVYVADTCSFALSAQDSHVMLYNNIARRGSYVVTAATLEEWGTRIGEEGYLYVRFNPSVSSRVSFLTDKPAETDPEGPVTPDPVYTSFDATVCFGDSYEWNGQSYSTAGEYKQSFIATNGADSIVTLKLTILPEVAPTTEEATIEAGETYTWNGKEYTEAGEYPITLQDKNGCDYQATLVLKVNKPLSPCLQSSIKLNVGDEVVINLDSAFTVYAIDYAAWMAQPVTLVWTGAEALHTFVAETCVFALAPYNKYVHAYVPVPAQGDSALDMEALAPYVDEDGYLYVRFLTEFEGVLTINN